MLMMSPQLTAAMMVAMMLPSVSPTFLRCHRTLRATQMPGAVQRTTLFAAGYAAVWTAIDLAMSALNAELSPLRPLTLGMVILCGGVLQSSRWKAMHLRRCRDTRVPAPNSARIAWRDGCRFGVHCALSCAAPMTVLFVLGLMDIRVMLLITAAITAERVAPGGLRIARLTGAVAVIAGLLVCAVACVTISTPGW